MHDVFESPLTARYVSKEMSFLFSAQKKFSTWRRVWLALAESEKALGLDISQKQINEMRSKIDVIDFAAVKKYEKRFRHDVMAHIHEFGDQCPTARPIIHLGATSCLVTDNADLIIYREALDLLKQKLLVVLRDLGKFSMKHRQLACLAFTHLQPGQPTTVGKRAGLWLQDFVEDLEELDLRKDRLRFLGAKGATGTQASFLSLFKGDGEKVKELDARLASSFGFLNSQALAGQTYSRKQDIRLLDALSAFAVSAHKMASDVRLLAHMGEIEEPFKKEQVGSSAMPYKRNPMMSERICGLARFVISLSENPKYTAAVQWMERTLDDSSNRRLAMSEAFLTVDAILNILGKLVEGLEVYPKVIEKNLRRELPFLATENILMACVQKGGDRQALHEKLRLHTHEIARLKKEEGVEGDLFALLAEDSDFPISGEDLERLLRESNFVGRSAEQVKEYYEERVEPLVACGVELPSFAELEV